MKLITVQQCQVGMKLGEDIYGNFDLLYASKGDIVSERILEGLKKLPLDYLYVEDVEVATPSLISDQQRELIIEAITHSLSSYRLLTRNVFDKIKIPVLNIIQQLFLDDYALYCFNEFKTIDDYTFDHALNVGLIAGMIGYWQEHDIKTIETLIIAGFFHDLGKLSIDRNLLLKAGTISDTELQTLKDHSLFSLEHLHRTSFATSDIEQAILQHHERRDGSGYPAGLMAKDIHPLARILAVADTYHAATSDKSYRTSITPVHACDEIFTQSLDSLDPEAATTLIKNLQKLYIGVAVQLSNHAIGEIVYLNRFNPNKPLVKCQDQFYDLSMRSDLHIVKILSS